MAELVLLIPNMPTKPTLLILAAGMATRYGSLKQLDGFGPNGETIIDYSVYDAVRAGFGKIVFVIRASIQAEFEATMRRRFPADLEITTVNQELDLLPHPFRCHPAGASPGEPGTRYGWPPRPSTSLSRS